VCAARGAVVAARCTTVRENIQIRAPSIKTSSSHLILNDIHAEISDVDNI
jgi:hypothetical protein